MSVRKSYKYKLKPTADQERLLDETLWRCRDLYNAGLEQRIWAYRKCGVSVTHAQQEAELPSIREAFPEYAAIHSQVLQDVLTRLDKAYQAFFRRVKAGQTPGFPRFQGRTRYHSFTYKQFGNGAHTWTTASWSCRKSAASRCAGRVPLEGTPKTVTHLT